MTTKSAEVCHGSIASQVEHAQSRRIVCGRSNGQWRSKIESKKLKPAKQALADAIHQNGGWPNHGDCNFATSNDRRLACFFTERPVKGRFTEWSGWVRIAVLSRTAKPLPNWHQTILSRDEYFTAYPEQVKVEICNETKHKVEVEMESESEITIKVGDWYKNGKLPPVGEAVMLNSTNQNDYWSHHVGAELTVVAHDKDSRGVGIAVYRFVDADGYNEYHGLVAHAFMPLRTEREKAIDEMVDFLAERRGSVEDIATHLYENGYRREVK